MDSMPRPRPPHLHRQVTRHGAVVWYVRKGRGQRVRIKGEYLSDAFMEDYRAALENSPKPPAAKETSGSLAWLIARYRETGAWLRLSAATRRQRENIFKHVIKTAGKDDYRKIGKATIVAGRERRAKTPSQARNFLDAMRGVFRWAVDADLLKADPTIGVKNPERPRTGGFPAWNEDDVAKYEKRWPLGTKERVWLDVVLYTGLRRGDLVRIGKQHVRNGVATLKTEKGGYTIEVNLPILPVLERTLKAGPTADMAFICGANGDPLKKESFGNYFREASNAAGVSKSLHGVRKIAATRAAESGATVAQLEAIFGWHGGQMAALYTRAADRKRLAAEAMHKLGGNNEATSIPSPSNEVRASGEKAK